MTRATVTAAAAGAAVAVAGLAYVVTRVSEGPGAPSAEVPISAAPDPALDAGRAADAAEFGADEPEVERGPESLSGRVVTGGGQPVGGVSVLVGGAAAWPPVVVETAPDGTFTATGLYEGEVDVWARGEGVASAVMSGVRVGDVPLEISVSPARCVRGGVRNRRTQSPVGGARITLGESWPATLAIRTTTDVAGVFEAGCLRPGRYHVTVQAPGYVPLVGLPLDVEVDEPIELTLSPGAGVEIAVVGPDDAPVERAEVALQVKTPSGERRLVDGRAGRLSQRIWRMLSGEATFRPLQPVRFRTDRAGLVRLAGLPAGVATVRVTARDRLGGEKPGVALEEGRTAVVRVQLRRYQVVKGRVIDAGGEPIANATVSLTGGSPPEQTADDGRFTLVGRPGAATLTVRLEDGSSVIRQLQLKGDEPIETEIVVQGAGEFVEVFVVDADDSPVEGATVTVSAASKAVFRGRTDAEGRLEASGLPRGPYGIVARDGELVPGRQKGVEPGATVTIVLVDGGSLEVEVLDAGLDPVEGARVTLVGQDIPAATTGADGLAVFERVPAGRYRARVRATGRVPTTSASVTVVNDEVAGPLRVTLADAGGLKGKVVSNLEVGLAGVLILASSKALKEPLRVRSDARGRFEIGGLPPGDVQLAATHPGWTHSTQREVVVEGEVFEDVVLFLDPEEEQQP